MSLQRYEFRNGAGYEEEATLCENGDFVKYADVVAEITSRLECAAKITEEGLKADYLADISFVTMAVDIRALKENA